MSHLTSDEQQRLQSLESCIHRGLVTFLEVGAALDEIRVSRLYRNAYRTFDEYLRVRWRMSGKRAYDLINSSQVVQQLQAAGITDLPTNASQTRPLQPLPAAEVPRIWREVTQAVPQPERTKLRIQQTVKQLAGEYVPEPREVAGIIAPRTVRFSPIAWERLTAAAGAGQEYALLEQIIAGLARRQAA